MTRCCPRSRPRSTWAVRSRRRPAASIDGPPRRPGTGLGPAVGELEFEERPSERFLFFAADKTDPGAYNLPLYLAFADPMNTPGLMLSPEMAQGFKFVIMDVAYTEGDRVVELKAPEDLYSIATLLRDTERYVVESVSSRATGEQAVSVSTSRLHNVVGLEVDVLADRHEGDGQRIRSASARIV